jgi:hypothetical protein
VKSQAATPETLVTGEAEDTYQLMNLPPRMTGLPMVVWVSQRGNARHDVRVKVNMAHGRQMRIENTAVVAVRPSPRVIVGQLASEDSRVVSAWIRLNQEALVAYWDDDIDTGEFLDQLKLLPAS